MPLLASFYPVFWVITGVESINPYWDFTGFRKLNLAHTIMPGGTNGLEQKTCKF